MIGKVVVSFAVWIFVVSPLVASPGAIGQELDRERTEVLEEVSRGMIDYLCNNADYLGCFHIDSMQCTMELKKVAEDCKKLKGSALPSPEEKNQDSYFSFGVDLGNCLMEKHLSEVHANNHEASRCLNEK